MTCVALLAVVICNAAPLLSNGYRMSWLAGPYGGGQYGYNTTMTYECNVGNWFSAGIFQQTVTCSNTGNWTSLDDCIGTLYRIVLYTSSVKLMLK